MSKVDTNALWNAVQDSESAFIWAIKHCHSGDCAGLTPAVSLPSLVGKDDFAAFNKVNGRLLYPVAPLKNVPLRIYLPSTPSDASPSATGVTAAAGSFKVLQTLVQPQTRSRESFAPPQSPSLRKERKETLAPSLTSGLDTHPSRNGPDRRPPASQPAAVALPQQQRPGPGERDLARRPGPLFGAPRGADARGRVS
jgi:hypothetical protein